MHYSITCRVVHAVIFIHDQWIFLISVSKVLAWICLYTLFAVSFFGVPPFC